MASSKLQVSTRELPLRKCLVAPSANPVMEDRSDEDASNDPPPPSNPPKRQSQNEAPKENTSAKGDGGKKTTTRHIRFSLFHPSGRIFSRPKTAFAAHRKFALNVNAALPNLKNMDGEEECRLEVMQLLDWLEPELLKRLGIVAMIDFENDQRMLDEQKKLVTFFEDRICQVQILQEMKKLERLGVQEELKNRSGGRYFCCEFCAYQ